MHSGYGLPLALLLAACGPFPCLAPPAGLSAGEGPMGPTLQPEGVDLQWTDASTCEAGFEIERAVNGATFSRIATTAADATRYLDLSVIAPEAGAYCYGCSYRVRATDGDGAGSAWSNVAVGPWPPSPPPPP